MLFDGFCYYADACSGAGAGAGPPPPSHPSQCSYSIPDIPTPTPTLIPPLDLALAFVFVSLFFFSSLTPAMPTIHLPRSRRLSFSVRFQVRTGHGARVPPASP